MHILCTPTVLVTVPLVLRLLMLTLGTAFVAAGGNVHWGRDNFHSSFSDNTADTQSFTFTVVRTAMVETNVVYVHTSETTNHHWADPSSLEATRSSMPRGRLGLGITWVLGHCTFRNLCGVSPFTFHNGLCTYHNGGLLVLTEATFGRRTPSEPQP